MPTATQQSKQLVTHDLDSGSEREIAIERHGARINFDWPCGQRFAVSRVKLEAALMALDDKPPKATRHVSIVHAVTARGLYSRFGAAQDVTFTLEGKGAVRVYSSYEEESALLPLKDLRAALKL